VRLGPLSRARVILAAHSVTRQGSTYTREPETEARQADEARDGAFLVLALECDRPLAPASRHALAGLDEVALGRAGEREVARERDRLALGVPDGWMSQRHARLTRQLGRWVVEDLGSKNGVLVNGRRAELTVLDDGDLVELGHTLFLFCAGRGPDEPLPADCRSDELAGDAPQLATFAAPLARRFADLGRVVAAALPVVIQGATGTGKELVARAAHELSGRAGAFVAVNCGALAPTLVESELFGYRKGAFSGAAEDRPGLVRSADRGTLFLDEIAELPASNQAALLRVLQEREVMPVGAARPIPVDLQLVAATQGDLAERVAAGTFREDLLARLSGFTVHLPRLAERREDLGMLISTLLARHAPAGSAVRIEVEAARALFRHAWPHNVRELERSLGVAFALAGGGVIKPEHLAPGVRGEEASASASRPAKSAGQAGPASDADRLRRDELVILLREHGGNVSAVARASGKARTQIQRWVKRYGLDPSDFRR
jgi:sigma-54 dependent transcriptional regulator, acetoin dehydrogenase operon transcriptional activator AcoR